MTVTVQDDHLAGVRTFKIEITKRDMLVLDADPAWVAEPHLHSQVLTNLAIIAQDQERRSAAATKGLPK